ncbi:hypothetical protein CYMTET_20206 [Cymbomonas tetramitiformis]|uniref:HIT-type domain-containing protein n=1 Tax=Cymbomonas tetramitiformis TaxID=36881 RepID=A0AAE0L4F7_9CHLO|nr:hypothetical protein CYMTET_20206 [Cymbomonas tetramitiformis]
MSVVDKETRKQVAAARLDALENDNVAHEAADDDSDDYTIEDEDSSLGLPGKGKKKGKGAATKRKTRHALNARRGPKPFAVLLDEAQLEDNPESAPNYFTAAAAPPKATSARHFCSVCGFTSTYTCVRCGARFCSRPLGVPNKEVVQAWKSGLLTTRPNTEVNEYDFLVHTFGLHVRYMG